MPLTQVKVKTGLAVQIPVNHYGKIEDKSSTVTKQNLKTIAGVIDADYRGEIIVCLYNLSKKSSFLITKGQAIAQLIIQKFEFFEPCFDDILTTTSRGSGGFGSTS